MRDRVGALTSISNANNLNVRAPIVSLIVRWEMLNKKILRMTITGTFHFSNIC